MVILRNDHATRPDRERRAFWFGYCSGFTPSAWSIP